MTRAGSWLARDPVLAFAMCSACALSLTSFGSFPALLPRLFTEWGLSTRDATFVNAAFYAGYVSVSPILATLTDRIDARRIVLGSCALGVVTAVAFAASGGMFWWAISARALSGVATAGSFMPGLRALTDRASLAKQARYVGYYMGCFALGTSLSYVACEALASAFSAGAALWCMALGPLLALLLTLGLSSVSPPSAHAPEGALRLLAHAPEGALRPAALRAQPWLPNPMTIVRNRPAFGLVCCYGLHTWELFALRSWGALFLSSVQKAHGFHASFWWAPATVIALANVLTVPASVFGVSFAERLGRVRWVGGVMVASSLGFGLLAWADLLPPPWASAAVLVCGALMGADSATLTSGVVAQVPVAERGLGMAVHTTVGFLGAFVGPLVFGLILDAAGGPGEPEAWTKSFAISGGITLLTGIFVRFLTRRAEIEQSF